MLALPRAFAMLILILVTTSAAGKVILCIVLYNTNYYTLPTRFRYDIVLIGRMNHVLHIKSRHLNKTSKVSCCYGPVGADIAPHRASF